MKKTIQKFVWTIAVSAMIFTGCDEKIDLVLPAFAPDIVSISEGSSTTVSITAGKEPFTVQSLSESIATAKVEGKTITVTGVSVGTVNINVSGSDGASAKLAVAVTQREANAPALSTSVVDVEAGFTASVSITGGTAPFTVSSSDNRIATATIQNRTVTVTGIDGGTVLITVKGSDDASATFAVNVNGEQIFFGPNKTQFGSGRHEFYIQKSHTIRKGVYTMVGWIYVEEGATLTIEPGTVFKGTDYNYNGTKSATGSSLIIKRGAKIMAEGTATEPIVFTSAKPKGQRQATDWGGIIICGKAKNNQREMLGVGGVDAYHGGDDDNDNSGVLRYCRLEFGGYPYNVDTEINGLTLGSVGRGTTIDHIQVSYCGDDSYEWFGGSVNCKYLVAYHGWDDDFDTDNGFSGKLQFLLGVRDPKIADQSNSNGFESDNNANGTEQTPFTTCVFSNVTLIGPTVQDPNFENVAGTGYISGYNWGASTTADYPIRTGIFQAAMQIRRNSRLSCFNSVFTGYPLGIMLSNDGRGDSQGAANNDLLKIKNVFFAGMGRTGADADKKNPADWSGTISSNYFKQSSLNNREFTSIEDLKLKQFKSKKLPLASSGFAADDSSVNWGPTAGSPLLGAADFSDALLNNSFFTRVNYVGAFASDSDADNWLKGWANFDPQNTDY